MPSFAKPYLKKKTNNDVSGEKPNYIQYTRGINDQIIWESISYTK